MVHVRLPTSDFRLPLLRGCLPTWRLLATLVLLVSATPLAAPTPPAWPQWGGPTRDFVVSTPVPDALPAAGLRTVWSQPLGDGFSGIAVSGEALVTMYRREGREHIVSLEVGSGRARWDHGDAAPFSRDYSMENGEGPHATPLIAGGRVFAVGATGRLRALDATTGRLLWRHDLVMDLGGFIRVNGYASSPLAVGDTIVLPVGGKAGALVAFDQATGRIAWQSPPDRISPASPILIELGGSTQIVAFLYDRVAGFDPRSGRELWSHPHVTDFGLNVATPVWLPDQVLVVSSAYNGGTRALKLEASPSGTAVRELWFTNRLRSHVGPLLPVGDLLVGSSGDLGPAPLTALDPATGQVVWRNRAVGRATGLRVGTARVLLLDEDGQLVLASIARTGLTEHGRTPVTTGTAWTAPAVVGSRLYVRDRRDIKAFALE